MLMKRLAVEEQIYWKFSKPENNNLTQCLFSKSAFIDDSVFFDAVLEKLGGLVRPLRENPGSATHQ